MEENRLACIITAGGSGTRMGAGIPKQFLKIGGKTILEKTVQRFASMPEDFRIVLTVPAETEELCQSMFPEEIRICRGGETRQASVLEGLRALQGEGFPEDGIVLVQDGDRKSVV